MTDIRKATTEDIKLINELAWIAFPATYKDILTKEQIDYSISRNLQGYPDKRTD